MRAAFKMIALPLLAAASCGWAGASVTTALGSSEPRLTIQTGHSSSKILRYSLRRDVASHPANFIAFPTETAAIRFLNEHWMETSRETEHRMLDLGVVGYWQGRTIVVLPLAPELR